MANLTDNQFYGGLNRRFDKRVALLRRFGFKQEINDFGAFWVRRVHPAIKPQVVSSNLTMHACNRCWVNKLSCTLRRHGHLPPFHLK